MEEVTYYTEKFVEHDEWLKFCNNQNFFDEQLRLEDSSVKENQ